MKIAAQKFDQQQFCQQVADDLLLLWIIHSNIPFSMTSDNHFRALMQYLNHANRIPRSPTTVKLRIITHFGQLEPQIADLMKEATTQIHLSCDGWTSPHQTMAVIGVIAHFTSRAGVRMNPVIVLRTLEGSHTGANMAEIVMEVLQEYGIEEKLGYFVRDNASNNDTLVGHLSEAQVEGNRWYNASEYRLRSVGHVINLSVKAFWFGDVDHTHLHHTIVVTPDTMGAWRRMGPWGNAHNITIYVLASPQRQQELKRLGGDTILHKVNATQWNTGYTMIRSMIRNKDTVELFCLCHFDDLEDDRLSPDDWNQLADAVDVLEPFHSATLQMEGDFGELHNLLVGLDFLRTIFTNVLQKYPANPHLHIRRAAAESFVVLDKYLEIYKDLTVCVAAVVLHPAYKWEYFEVAVEKLDWTDDQLEDAKLRVQALWLTQYSTASSQAVSQGELQLGIHQMPITPFASWRAERQQTVIGRVFSDYDQSKWVLTTLQ